MADSPWETLYAELETATGDYDRAALIGLLRDLIREYVIERGLPTGAPTATTPDLSSLDFPDILSLLAGEKDPNDWADQGLSRFFALEEGDGFVLVSYQVGCGRNGVIGVGVLPGVLPGFVLRVQHEDVIDDLEAQVRRILDFCGLEFEASCVEFHKTKRTVRTPSAEQVRQPINTAGVDQWRHFEQFLDPLKNALGPELLDDYGIARPT